MKTAKSLGQRIMYHRTLYLLLLPTLLFYALFCYLPMFGVTLAFKELDYSLGIQGSPWVGLANFEQVFVEPDFWRAFWNTLIIAGMRLLVEFPLPIIIAVLINEVHSKRFSGVVRTFMTLPHFLSWIIVGGITINIFGTDGLWNAICSVIGGNPNDFLLDKDKFRWFLVFTNLWKEAGWGCIIYLAAIAGINQDLYEAAAIDGANRFQRMVSVTWPAISSTVAVMLVLFLAGVMNSGGGGFDQIFNLYNPSVMDTGDIIDTYIYRRTFYAGASMETSAAVGLFKSVINFAMVLGANALSRKISDEGVF